MTEAVLNENPRAPLAPTAVEFTAEQRSAVDMAVRPVVVWLFLTSVCWLLLSTSLGAFAALKLHFPHLLDYTCMSYGRLAPAAQGAFVFGWCSTAALGVVSWLLPRLSGGVAPGTTVASLGVVLWNAGVLLGVFANISGILRPLDGLEFPFASFVLMFGGLSLLAAWVLLGLSAVGTTSLAAMFVTGGFLWLGWSLFTGNLLIATKSVVGVVEQIVGAWTVSGVLWLWLVPVALGVAYYIVPKVTGRPIFSGSTGRSFSGSIFCAPACWARIALQGAPYHSGWCLSRLPLRSLFWFRCLGRFTTCVRPRRIRSTSPLPPRCGSFFLDLSCLGWRRSRRRLARFGASITRFASRCLSRACRRCCSPEPCP